MPSPPDRHRRRATAALATLAAVLALAAPAAPAARPSALPPQGLYEGCAPGAGLDACVARLARIRAGGFRYVLNYSAWYGSVSDVLRYADAAAALGLKLIWPLNHPAWRGATGLASTYPSFADGSDPGNEAFVATAVSLVANHPASWGFYVGDEVLPAEAPAVARLSATVRLFAPDSPQLYVARPGAARLAPFAPLVNVAGVTTYPLGSGDPPVRRAARSMLAVADAAGAKPAMVLQAFSWSQYRPAPTPPLYPGTRRLRAMRDATISHGDPAMILWYSYQDILRSDRPRLRWRQLVRAAFSPPRQPATTPRRTSAVSAAMSPADALALFQNDKPATRGVKLTAHPRSGVVSTRSEVATAPRVVLNTFCFLNSVNISL